MKWSALGGHDDNVLSDAGNGSDPQVRTGGTWQTGEASLQYALGRRRLLLNVNTSLSGRYYTELHELNGLAASGDVRFTANLSRRMRISATQGGRSQPYYQFNFPTSVPSQWSVLPFGTDALTKRESLTHFGTVDFSRVTTRSSLTVGYDYRHTRFSDTANPFLWQLASSTFTRKLTKYGGLRLGYGYGETHDGLRPKSPVVGTQNIDVGLTYNRQLSAAHRTAVSFSSGSTLVTYEANTSYVLVLDANVARALGRNWIANGGYHRGVTFIEGFAGPVYADTVQLRVAGRVMKRLELGVSSGYANGQQGLSTASRGYATYSAATDVRFALNRQLWFTTQVGYYRYDFDGAAPVPLGLSRTLGRRSVLIGLTGLLH
jgi:hypothetical protein